MIELDRRAGHVGIDGLELVNKLLLVLTLPHVFLGINHEQILAGDADEAVPERLRQVLDPHRRAVVLVAQRVESVAHIVQQRLLKRSQLQ